MKRIYKLISYIVLCTVILSLPLCLVACNKNDDMKQFYGEYQPKDDYCTVYFSPQSEIEDSELATWYWYITSVGESSFTYIDDLHGDKITEKECDAFLLKSVKRLMSIMGNKATLSDGLIYLNDSDWDIKYDYVHRTSDSSNDYWILYNDKIEVGAIGCSKEQIEDQEFYVVLYDDYVIDENGVEWEITVNKSFSKSL